MSKKKKTIEELLEEAILPDEEQSYEVPRNWVWTRVENAIKPMETREPKKLDGEVFHYIDVDAIDNKKQSVRQVKEVEITLAPSRAKRKVSKDDVIISLVRPYLKNIAHIDIDDNKLVASTAFYVCTPKEILDSNYLYSYLCSNYATQYLIDHTRGDNSPSVRSTDYEKMPLPLPPVNEQKRIAEKVERFLSKIEEAKQLIEEAKETFELRRAAIIRTILKEELSNGKLPTGWRNIKVKELFTTFGGGTPSKAKEEYWNGRIPWISAKDMKTTFISETMDYITEEGLNNSSAKLAKRGSVAMVVRSGILQRTLPVAFLLSECTVNQDLKVFDSGDELINKYFLWYVKGNEKNLLHNYSKSGTTVNSIEFEKFKSHEILLPPMDVLKQKIDKIENVIEKEKSANVMLNLANSIDELKSSILSKAFRGELGTNDPSEENAIELLKEVLQEQVK